MVDFRLLFGAVDFQVAHDHVPLSPLLKEDKGVRGKKGRGIKHIGVGLTGGNNQQGLPSFHGRLRRSVFLGGFSICLSHVGSLSREKLSRMAKLSILL